MPPASIAAAAIINSMPRSRFTRGDSWKRSRAIVSRSSSTSAGFLSLSRSKPLKH
jgi:hypothetical protein